MVKILSWFSIRDNVTLFIAIVGFALSLLSWGHTLWISRKHLAVEFDFDCSFGCAYISSLYHCATLALFFENKSANPISITYLEIVTANKDRFRCKLEKCFVAHKFRNTIDNNSEGYNRLIESAEFPIVLCGFGASYQYVDFSLPKGRTWNDISCVNVQTNRGRIILNKKETLNKLEEFLQIPLKAKEENPCTTANIAVAD